MIYHNGNQGQIKLGNKTENYFSIIKIIVRN